MTWGAGSGRQPRPRDARWKWSGMRHSLLSHALFTCLVLCVAKCKTLCGKITSDGRGRGAGPSNRMKTSECGFDGSLNRFWQKWSQLRRPGADLRPRDRPYRADKLLLGRAFEHSCCFVLEWFGLPSPFHPVLPSFNPRQRKSCREHIFSLE